MLSRPEVVSRRTAVIAGHQGDLDAVRGLIVNADPKIRASGLGALLRRGALEKDDLTAAIGDDSAIVRGRAALLAAKAGPDLVDPGALRALLDDRDPAVCEAACFAAGEQSEPAAGIVERLCEIATAHEDALCRESAVAALGSLGDERGRDAVLAGCRDKPTVRRRAVLALVAFDGTDVDAMLEEMAGDVDWQVRQAAEELLAIT